MSQRSSIPTLGDNSMLDASRMTAELKRRGRDVDIKCTETVSSTQDAARQTVTAVRRRSLIVAARHQTSGRGRRGRKWLHIPGNLAFTVGTRLPADAPPAWPTIATPVSVVQAIETHAGVALGIKWPNDIVSGTRKAGGVLTELHHGWAFVGVGLNVNAAPGIADGTPTVSIAELAGRMIDLTGLMIELADAILCSLLAKPSARRAIHETWSKLSTLRGQEVVVEGPDGRIYGRVKSLPEDGSLHLVLKDGTRRVFHNGEVSLRLEIAT